MGPGPTMLRVPQPSVAAVGLLGKAFFPPNSQQPDSVTASCWTAGLRPLEPFGVFRAETEVARVRMMEDERRDGAFRLHHEAFRQVHADLALDVEQAEELRLVLEA